MYLFTLLSLFLLIMTCGCTVGPDYVPPAYQADMKAASFSSPFINSDNETSISKWWAIFNDPVLSSIIDQASKNNLDVKIAVARIREARAAVGVQSADFLPEVNGNGSISRSRQSEDVAPMSTGAFTEYYTGFDASWEIDLFGRIRRSVEAAEADYEAMKELRNDVLVTLCSDVAVTYFTILTLKERIRTTEKNIESQKGTLKLTETRYKYGIATYLDVAQARQVLADTEAALPSLKSSLNENINSLLVLLGEAPSFSSDILSRIHADGPDVHVPLPPVDSALSIPLNSIRKRPDIRQAERKLAAQTARIGVATANLYPSLSLTGSFGFTALNSADMFNSSSQTYGIGPVLKWNIFDAGKIRNQIKVEDARTEQALHNYELTVLTAMKEVNDSLVAYHEQRNKLNAVKRSVKASRETLDMALRLYKDGLTDFQNVLDAQRSLLTVEDNLDVAIGNTSIQLVKLYKALGGGWGTKT